MSQSLVGVYHCYSYHPLFLRDKSHLGDIYSVKTSPDSAEILPNKVV